MQPSTTGMPTREPLASDTAVKATPHNDSWKKWLIGSLIALVCLGGVWGWGFSQGRAALAPQRAAYEKRLQNSNNSLRNSEAQLKQAHDELAQSRYRTRLLEARALLLRTAIDLEKRNFGTANTRLRSAASELQNLPSSDSANSALTALQREVATTNLVVASDVEQQRSRVLEFGERLDRLTPLDTRPSP